MVLPNFNFEKQENKIEDAAILLSNKVFVTDNKIAFSFSMDSVFGGNLLKGFGMLFTFYRNIHYFKSKPGFIPLKGGYSLRNESFISDFAESLIKGFKEMYNIEEVLSENVNISGKYGGTIHISIISLYSLDREKKDFSTLIENSLKQLLMDYIDIKNEEKSFMAYECILFNQYKETKLLFQADFYVNKVFTNIEGPESLKIMIKEVIQDTSFERKYKESKTVSDLLSYQIELHPVRFFIGEIAYLLIQTENTSFFDSLEESKPFFKIKGRDKNKDRATDCRYNVYNPFFGEGNISFEEFNKIPEQLKETGFNFGKFFLERVEPFS
jgi:hypothetical protein